MARCPKHLLLVLAITAASAVSGCGHAQKPEDKSTSAQAPAAVNAAADDVAKQGELGKEATTKEATTAEGVPTPAAPQPEKAAEGAAAATNATNKADRQKEREAALRREREAALAEQIPGWSLLFVFMLATFIGLGVILRVSRLLHTPLMSLTNAISAIAVVGSIIVVGETDRPTWIRFLGALALFASTTNIISGFLITDRMLKMFKAPGGGGKR
jgi:NAD(P) transhydrogenase subunit alpha